MHSYKDTIIQSTLFRRAQYCFEHGRAVSTIQGDFSARDAITQEVVWWIGSGLNSGGLFMILCGSISQQTLTTLLSLPTGGFLALTIIFSAVVPKMFVRRSYLKFGDFSYLSSGNVSNIVALPGACLRGKN